MDLRKHPAWAAIGEAIKFVAVSSAPVHDTLADAWMIPDNDASANAMLDHMADAALRAMQASAKDAADWSH